MRDMDINRQQKCAERSEELWQQIKDKKLILPIDEKHPLGQKVWVLEYGDIPMQTSIRKAELRVRWADDDEMLPWVEWAYYVKGNRQAYWADELYKTRRESELAIAREELKEFITSFSCRINRYGFTKEDFPELETLKELKQLQ